MTAYDAPVNRSLQRLEQMRKLIMDLLDMTRLESGQKRRELEPVNVTEAARSAIELMSTAAAQREITLALDSKEEITIHADRGEMDMMFNNLVSNAVKYNRDGGNVNVAVERVNGQLQIAVSDTGIGMTPEEVERLFGEFVRIKNEQTRNVLGSGLGLSILKRLAQLYDGDVTVESEEGKGSTFTVTLKTLEGTPAAEEEEQETS
jgi:signal transduction histidine kinase